jgi:hypothetical protein
MDADTRQLLTSSLRSLFAEGGDIASGLDALGWGDVLEDDEATATALLFQEQGQALARSNALDSVISGALDLPPLPVLHPTPGDALAPLQGERVVGVLLNRAPTGPFLAIGRSTALLVADVKDLEVGIITGFDPTAGLSHVAGPAHGEQLSSGPWETAVTAARRSLASELIGLGRGSLTLAVGQLTVRHQFGRPLGSNQSPRHRLAEAHVGLAAAENLVTEAWRKGDTWSAMAAKAQAGQAAETAARAAMQVCGAMGLTHEHQLGGFVRRTFALDGLYCGWRELSRQLGKHLVDEATTMSEAS